MHTIQVIFDGEQKTDMLSAETATSRAEDMISAVCLGAGYCWSDRFGIDKSIWEDGNLI